MRRSEGNGVAGLDWTGRFFVSLSVVTLVVHLLGLQLRMALFGGTGWLTSVKYVSWADRLGLGLILAVFSVAAAGLWLLLWVGGLRLLRVGRFHALCVAAATWVVLLVVDWFIRQQILDFLGDAYDFMAVLIGAGGVSLMVKNLWEWYGGQILIGIAVCLGLGLACFFALRFFRNARRSWGVIDRIRLRTMILVVAVCVVTALTFLTAFSQTWPTTRELVTRHMVIGLPFGALVVSATDFDGDGYSQFENPPDSKPFDPSCHPHALDTPGDGIDQDLIAGDLCLEEVEVARKALVEATCAYPPVEFTRKKNVILIALESVRYDSLETCIEGQEVTPRLRALIREGALAPPHAYCSNGYTSTSMTHLFCGGFYNPGSSLVDDFKANGYFLATFSAYDNAEQGFERNLGLGECDLIVDSRHLELALPRWTVPARRLMEPIEEFLRTRDRRQPFFMFIFFDDAHFPYLQDNECVLIDEPFSISKISSDNTAELRRAFYNQVYHVDKAIGLLADILKETGQLQDTIMVVTSDHGESLFDDGLLVGHGIRLNDVMTRLLMVFINPTRDVPELIAQYHLRSLVREMLTQPTVAQPRLVKVPGRRIPQFLGWTPAPSQIGEVSLEQGRLLYDFKSNRVRDERSGVDVEFDPEAMDPELYRRARAMILGWEYLQYRNRHNGRWRF